ncbi:MAG: tRNA (guanosine(37)-N1)-methyltransferase TrmD, partial [Acidobacteria bacterium]|nr:tRNA (guanosine(37)-N1)-methyltransferase TrmD [Acidobacteriota bacterium]
GLLDYPQYTRPADFRGYTAPLVLRSGNHQAIATWRRQQSLLATARKRPDLLVTKTLSEQDQVFLKNATRE